jgi:signal transduction histidine kinase
MQLEYLSAIAENNPPRLRKTQIWTFLLAATAAFTLSIGLITIPQVWGPYMGYTFNPINGAVLVVERDSPAQKAGVQVGDVLTHIDGVPLGQVRPLYRNLAVGTTVQYTFYRDGAIQEIGATWTAPPATELTRRLLHFTLSVTFWLLGLVVFLNQRNKTVAHVFLMVTAWGASALWLVPLTDVGVEWATQLMYVAHLLAGASFFHFHLLFPVVNRGGLWRLLNRISYILAFGLSVVVLAISPSRLDAWTGSERFAASLAFGKGVSIYFTATIILGLLALLRTYRQGTGNARRKIRLIVFGTLFGMSPLLVYYALRYIYPVPYELATIALVLIPLAYTISISHFDLMAVDYVLYRILVILILGLSLMAAYLGVVALVNLYDPSLAQNPLTGALICVIVSGGFAPIHKAVNISIGWFFYGHSRNYSTISSESVRLLTDQLDIDTLVHVLTTLIPSAIGVGQSALLTATKDSTALKWEGGQLRPRDLQNGILLDELESETLRQLQKGRLVPQALNTNTDLFDGAVRWWVPLRLANELQGVWVMGPRINDESFGPTTIELMQEAAANGAFVIKVLETVEQLREQREEAKSSARELFEAYSMLFKAQDNERGRFSRDLHDGVLQHLYGLDLTIQQIRSNTSQELDNQLVSLQCQINKITQSARDVCYGLRPADLQKLGLPGALRRLIRDMEDRVDTLVTVEFSPPYARFQEELEVTLYYIAQEALNNIVKHSRAKRAEVQLAVTPTGVMLFIQDDGVGFDQAQVEGKRLGLVGISQRVSAFGGTLEIDSAPGSGTAIAVEIPLVQQELAA